MAVLVLEVVRRFCQDFRLSLPGPFPRQGIRPLVGGDPGLALDLAPAGEQAFGLYRSPDAGDQGFQVGNDLTRITEGFQYMHPELAQEERRFERRLLGDLDLEDEQSQADARSRE